MVIGRDNWFINRSVLRELKLSISLYNYDKITTVHACSEARMTCLE
jgi:hypothetical protein